MWRVVSATSFWGKGCGEGALGGLHQVGNGHRGGEREAALGLADVVAADCLHANLGDQLPTVVHPQRLAFGLRREVEKKSLSLELTFSLVQVHEVHGEILLLAPNGMSMPSTLHLCAWGWGWS